MNTILIYLYSYILITLNYHFIFYFKMIDVSKLNDPSELEILYKTICNHEFTLKWQEAQDALDEARKPPPPKVDS